MSEAAPIVGVLPDASSTLVDRVTAAGVEPRVVEDGSPEEQRIECLLLEPPLARAIPAARGARADEQSLQIVVALSDAADRTQAERALLFAPGLGEVWVVGIDEVDRALLQRAAEVARQRRGYRRLRRRLTGEATAFGTRQIPRTRISDAYLAALLEVLGDAVLSVDADGTVRSWNAAAERILGRTGSEIEGSPIEKLVAPVDPVTWRRALSDGESATTAVAIEHGGTGDAARIAEITVTPLNAEGALVRVVVMHDVTEQRRAQIELERQTVELENQAAQLQEQAAELEMMNVELQAHGEALEEALASRSRFYAAMSHELRTPMNAIIGYNALLLDSVYGELPEAQASAVERAQRAAKHLLELVNDVLDLAKIEAGRIELQPEVASIPELLHELSDTVRPLAEEHGSELLVQPLENAPPCSVITDPRRVRQILLNLLSNAIKFGSGRPVRLSWEPVDGGGAVIHVIDQGIGIAPEDQQRIFEEFVQVDAGGHRAADGTGTGLGLPISKRLAGFLCGELGFTSEPGRGSDFRLRLPAALPEDGCDEVRRTGPREPVRR